MAQLFIDPSLVCCDHVLNFFSQAIHVSACESNYIQFLLLQDFSVH